MVWWSVLCIYIAYASLFTYLGVVVIFIVREKHDFLFIYH